MITVMIIDCESLALETGNTTKCMSCAPTIDLQAISNKQQPLSNEQQAMTQRLSVGLLLLIIEKKLGFFETPIFCLHFYISTTIRRGRSLVDKLRKLELSLAHSKRIKKIALLVCAVEGHKLYQNQGVVSRKILYCE